jgi:hypothetical protein
MKTNFIKKTVSFAVILFTLLAISTKSYAQAKDYENRYFYLYVSGKFQENKTAYISDAIFYSNYKECGDIFKFQANAKYEFSNYLTSKYNSIFPKGSYYIMIGEYIEKTSNYLKTKEDVSNRINVLKKSELNDNFNSVQTSFVYKCQ